MFNYTAIGSSFLGYLDIELFEANCFILDSLAKDNKDFIVVKKYHS